MSVEYVYTRAKSSGYTLMEVAIVIIVVGILIAAFSPVYSLYIKNKAIANTELNINFTMSAISNFFAQNGRYPCPARLDAQRTDADYGLETDCKDLTVLPGTCSGGICVERSARLVNLPPPTYIRVRRGAIPFRILNKPEFMAEDGYHARLEYVVTELLTDVSTYNKDNGGIDVVDAQTPPRSLVKTPGTIHFIVMSHGPDNAGAYSNSGKPILPCGAGEDSENCNTSMANKDAVYTMAQTNTTAGAGHFDDSVKFYSAVKTPLWVVADPAGFDIRDAGVAKQSGVGQDTSFINPLDPASIDVKVHAHASNNFHTGSVCNQAGTDCFSPGVIGGSNPGNAAPMNCPPGQYVDSIAGGAVHCIVSGPPSGCTAPQVMIGVNAVGVVQCTTPVASCPTQSVSVCALNDDTVLAAPAGTSRITPVHGDSRQHQYTCQPDGTWLWTGWWGSCSCTAGTVVTNSPCTAGQLGQPAGSCWSGTITTTTTTTCSPISVTSTSTNTCVCSDCLVTGSNGCTSPLLVPAPSYPSGFTGNIFYNRNWVCSNPAAGSFTPWVYASDNCTCAPGTVPELGISCSITGCDASGGNPSLAGQFPCSAGYVGPGKYVNRHHDYQCPAGTWGPWVNDVNTCSCSATTEARSTLCPSGYSGTIAQTRTFDCATNSWGSWINDLPGAIPASCIAIQWIPQGSISGSGSTPSGVRAYTACSPINSLAACYTPGSFGTYNYYSQCKCQ